MLDQTFLSDLSQHDGNHLHEDVYEQEASVETSEGQDSRYDRDHVHVYDEDGEVTEQTGEIDLSTLPDFVESPEAAEEAEQELNIESTDAPHLENAAFDGTPNDDSEILDDNDNDDITFEVPTTETTETDQNQEISSRAEEIASEDLGGRQEEDISSINSNGVEVALSLQSDDGTWAIRLLYNDLILTYSKW